jgi:hypothetical protein
MIGARQFGTTRYRDARLATREARPWTLFSHRGKTLLVSPGANGTLACVAEVG